MKKISFGQWHCVSGGQASSDLFWSDGIRLGDGEAYLYFKNTMAIVLKNSDRKMEGKYSFGSCSSFYNLPKTFQDFEQELDEIVEVFKKNQNNQNMWRAILTGATSALIGLL